MCPLLKDFLQKCLHFCRGNRVSTTKVKDILDDDILIRMLFDSEQYNKTLNKLEKNAIPTTDLQSRGLSLDIKRLASEKVVMQRAQIQKGRAQEKNGPADTTRKDIYLSEAEHPSISEIADSLGGALFVAKYDPVEGNDAHAVLTCVKQKETKAYYVMARNKLAPVFLKSITPAQEYRFLNK